MLDILPLEMRILRLCSISPILGSETLQIFFMIRLNAFTVGPNPLHIQGAVPHGMSYVLRGIINFFVKLNIVGLNFKS